MKQAFKLSPRAEDCRVRPDPAMFAKELASDYVAVVCWCDDAAIVFVGDVIGK